MSKQYAECSEARLIRERYNGMQDTPSGADTIVLPTSAGNIPIDLSLFTAASNMDLLDAPSPPQSRFSSRVQSVQVSAGSKLQPRRASSGFRKRQKSSNEMGVNARPPSASPMPMRSPGPATSSSNWQPTNASRAMFDDSAPIITAEVRHCAFGRLAHAQAHVMPAREEPMTPCKTPRSRSVLLCPQDAKARATRTAMLVELAIRQGRNSLMLDPTILPTAPLAGAPASAPATEASSGGEGGAGSGGRGSGRGPTEVNEGVQAAPSAASAMALEA